MLTRAAVAVRGAREGLGKTPRGPRCARQARQRLATLVRVTTCAKCLSNLLAACSLSYGSIKDTARIMVIPVRASEPRGACQASKTAFRSRCARPGCLTLLGPAAAKRQPSGAPGKWVTT